MAKLLEYSLIALMLFCLMGCPIPNHYLFINGKKEPERMLKIKRAEFEVSNISLSPVLSSKKKRIMLHFWFRNNSDNNIVLIPSHLEIRSSDDTFNIQRFYVGDFSIPYNNKDSLLVYPNDEKFIGIDFFSKKEYTRKGFNRTNRKDTISFRCNLFNGLDTTILMLNKKNKSTIFG